MTRLSIGIKREVGSDMAKRTSIKSLYKHRGYMICRTGPKSWVIYDEYTKELLTFKMETKAECIEWIDDHWNYFC